MIGITGKEYLLDAVLEYCEDIVTVKDLNLKYLADMVDIGAESTRPNSVAVFNNMF